MRLIPVSAVGRQVIRTHIKGMDAGWPTIPEAPARAPNVLMIVLDDVGFAQLGCYGGLGGRIDTPHIDRLAARGLRYTNWHTTALCSPTRACLLTGRNHHSVGVGVIMEAATPAPGYHGRIPHEAAMLPAVLLEHGYNTMCLGKWHLAPDEHNSAVGPYDRWPLGRGFERFYGFLPGETDQWHPDLWRDNHRVTAPATPEQGYHLTVDLVDRAVSMIGEQKAVAPDRPFFMYLALGACHSPHQAPKAYVDRYKGRFDAGWDVIRDETLARQKAMGVVPANTDLPVRNPGVQDWDRLSKRERRVFTRQMETFAGFLTHADDQIGRLTQFLDDAGQLNNTLTMLVSDNGASSEGGDIGLSSEMSYFNRVPETMQDLEKKIDKWGQPGTHPHYAMGWAMAGNTPQRWYKQQVHEGGVRDPFIVQWPARIKDAGAIRTQFHHAVDVVPTILEAIGVDMPQVVRGFAQMPIEGTSMFYSLSDGAAPTRKQVQYFELYGHRGIWKDGWKAVALHPTNDLARRYGLQLQPHDGDFDADVWELFNLDQDFSEAHDLAGQHPDKLYELQQLWHVEAEAHNVFPLDDRGAERFMIPKPSPRAAQDRYRFHAPVRLGRSSSPDVRRRSFSIEAVVDIPDRGAEGVIVSNGGHDGGFTLCIKRGRAIYVSNFLGREHVVIKSNRKLPQGPVTLRFEFRKTGNLSGQGTLFMNGHKVGEAAIPRTNPVAYAPAEGLEIGSDSTVPVWPQYSSPFAFTGHIRSVEIEVGSDRVDSAEDMARQAEVEMRRE